MVMLHKMDLELGHLLVVVRSTVSAMDDRNIETLIERYIARPTAPITALHALVWFSKLALQAASLPQYI